MKISKYKKLCKSSGQIIKTEIVTDETVLKGKTERVFLGTLTAKYRMNSFYKAFEPEDFADLWDISAKARDKMFFDTEVGNLGDEEGMIFRDSVKGETYVEPIAFSFALSKMEWKVFRTEDGDFVFVPAAELSPIDLEDEELNFWIRGDYLAIKRGLYLEGIVEIPIPEEAPVLGTALGRLKEVSDRIFDERGAVENGE